jgi:DNA modification methylase
MATKKKATTEEERRIDYVPFDELKPAKRNPKQHDLGALNTSLGRFSYVEPVVIDERTGRLVAGHGRIEALGQMLLSDAPPPAGVKTDAKGKWLIPVVRGWASKNDKEADAYLIASNRTVELGGWDDALLSELLGELAGEAPGAHSGLAGTGYDGDDVDELIAEVEDAKGPTESEKDEEPKPTEKPWVKLGDLFELGDHRILCGDSLKPDEVGRLLASAPIHAVIQDPPYAVFGSSTGIGADIADDKMIRPFLDRVCETVAVILPWFGHAYLFCDWRTSAPWTYAARAANLTQKNKLVWDKGGSGLGSMWANTHEEILFFSKTPPAKAMSSNKTRGERMVYRPNVLHFNRPAGDEREHNAAKPVALLCDLVEAATDAGETVFDGFCGSGSTLIACEGKGRRCFTMDLEPKWVQVAIERWERISGKKAKKLG